jgi:hypothetical protein
LKIAVEAWEPAATILNQAVHLLFLAAALAVIIEPDGDKFLVGEIRHPVITQAFVTSGGGRIVDVTDRYILISKFSMVRELY